VTPGTTVASGTGVSFERLQRGLRAAPHSDQRLKQGVGVNTTRRPWRRVAAIAGVAALAATTAWSPAPASARGRAVVAVGTYTDTLLKGPPWCLAAVQPEKSNYLRQSILMYADAAPEDTTWVSVRVALGNMPRTPASQISVVTDEQTCRKASRALDQWLWKTPQGAAVHLVKVGARYAIYAPGANRGEFGEVAHTDAQFNKIAISLF
jgi:hypothetical protein